jgi:hypothetical protein
LSELRSNSPHSQHSGGRGLRNFQQIISGKKKKY